MSVLSSLSLAKTKDFFILFFWVLNILPGGLIGLLTKMTKTNFLTLFFGPPGNVFGQQGVYMVELVAVFVSNILKCFSYSCDILL